MRTTINVEKPPLMRLDQFFSLVYLSYLQDPARAELQGVTWVLEFDKPHAPSAGYQLAVFLGEDCVAQRHVPDPSPVLSLQGPRAHAWEPFDRTKFKELSWRG